jgi:hypothetical protein
VRGHQWNDLRMRSSSLGCQRHIGEMRVLRWLAVCVCVCVCVCVSVYVCVSVSVHTQDHSRAFTHSHTHTISLKGGMRWKHHELQPSRTSVWTHHLVSVPTLFGVVVEQTVGRCNCWNHVCHSDSGRRSLRAGKRFVILCFMRACCV